MFAVRAGETVITVESRAGTEEEIVVILEVQHPVERSDRRHRDQATHGCGFADGGNPLFR